MKSRKALTAAILLGLMGSAGNAFGEVYLSKEEALEMAFARADRVEKKTEILPPGQLEEIARLTGARSVSRIFTYYEGFEGNRRVGYAVLGSARGTSRRFKFMMAVGVGLSIEKVEILSYQDMHGSEVRQGWFKRQFVGKRISNPIRINEDIRNVSGATISCEALAEKVRLSLAILTVVVANSRSTLEEGNGAAYGDSTNGTVHTPATLGTSPLQSGAIRRAQYRMGTLMEVTLYTRDAGLANRSFRRVFAEIGRLEDLLGSSRGHPEEGGPPCAAISGSRFMGPEIVRLLNFCVEMNELTLGAFDVTVSPLTRLWQEATERNGLPSPQALNRARSRVGANCLKMDPGRSTIEVLCEGIETDLGAVGKGYALDRAVALLKEEGIEAALLNFGGMIQVYGHGPNNGKWPIRVPDPADPSKDLATLSVTDLTVSTSSDTERGLEIGGKTYSHILDPRTGWPVSGMISVSVAAPSAKEADALSTGLYVAGLEEGRRIAENRSLAALIASEKGEFRTEAFRSLELKQE